MSLVFAKLNGIETLILAVIVVLCATSVLISVAYAFGRKSPSEPTHESHPVIRKKDA